MVRCPVQVLATANRKVDFRGDSTARLVCDRGPDVPSASSLTDRVLTDQLLGRIGLRWLWVVQILATANQSSPL